MLSPEDEQELIERVCQADRDALGCLLYAHSADLERYISRKLPRSVQGVLSAEDVLQETFTQVFRDIENFQQRFQGSFSAWLTTIAHHRLQDAVKTLKRKKRGGDRQPVARAVSSDGGSVIDLMDLLPDDVRTPSRSVSRREAIHAIQVAVAMLPDDYRDAVRLYYLEGKSLKEVSAHLGRSEGAVHGLIDRAKRKLRDALGSSSAFLTKR